MAGQNLISLDDALNHLLDRAIPVTRAEVVNLTDCLGRILAENHYVPADVPPADNSAVDGYAVYHGDVRGGEALTVTTVMYVMAKR